MQSMTSAPVGTSASFALAMASIFPFASTTSRLAYDVTSGTSTLRRSTDGESPCDDVAAHGLHSSSSCKASGEESAESFIT